MKINRKPFKISDELRQKFIAVGDSINEKVIAMEDVVHGILLAILAGGRQMDGNLIGEHVFMIGPPGVGKTYVGDIFMKCLELPEGGKARLLFDYLCNPFSTVGEFVGEMDLLKYKQNIIEKNIEGFLPDVYFGILDEIWKCGPALGVLMPLLNERKFNVGQKGTIKCPLISCITASNEYPSAAVYAPLYDRLLLRYYVPKITSKADRKKLNQVKRAKWEPATISIDEILQAKREVNRVQLPNEVAEKLMDVFISLEANGVVLSNRREEKIHEVVRAEAWLAGREKAQVSDIAAVIPCCWDHDRDIVKVRNLILKKVAMGLSTMMTHHDKAFTLYKGCMDAVNRGDLTLAASAEAEIASACEAVRTLPADGEGMEKKRSRLLTRIREWQGEVNEYADKCAGVISSSSDDDL